MPANEVARELDALREGLATRQDMRRLGRYTVHVYRGDLQRLNDAGVLTCIEDGLYALDDMGLYDEKLGLNVAVSGGNAEFL